jgi:hypothetical protein
MAIASRTLLSLPRLTCSGRSWWAFVERHGNYDQPTCVPRQATGYRIIPPGSVGSLILNTPQMVCSKPGVQGFRTSVVLPGTISS